MRGLPFDAGTRYISLKKQNTQKKNHFIETL